MLIMTFYAMIFFHIVADYNMQGVFAYMKTKAWWKANAPDPMYEQDYVIALATHSLFWAMMIMVPICWAYVDDVNPWMYTASLIINGGLHCLVDDLKANKHKINLIVDQLFHLGQIAITWAVFSM